MKEEIQDLSSKLREARLELGKKTNEEIALDNRVTSLDVEKRSLQLELEASKQEVSKMESEMSNIVSKSKEETASLQTTITNLKTGKESLEETVEEIDFGGISFEDLPVKVGCPAKDKDLVLRVNANKGKYVVKLSGKKGERFYRDDDFIQSTPENSFTDYKLKKDRAQATFWSGKGGVVVFNGNVKADVRASTNFAAPNFEILGKGARGGRAGYGAILYGAQKFLRTKLPTNAEYKNEANQIVREVKGKKSKTLQNKFYNMVKSTDSRISRQEFDEGIVRATPDRMHINLAATYIGNAISKSSKNQRDQFMTYMINLAGAKGSDSSVYVKVEES